MAILEVCAYNIQTCLIAEKISAKRVELCADPLQGGTTPSYGTIQLVREKLSIDVYAMIRPRGGDFLYDADELAIMKKDIDTCKQLGCNGIATGVQNADSTIDTETLKRIVEWAYPMGVTCHRVFDRVPDAFKALEDIIGTGCERILTSGLQKTAPEGKDILAKLVTAAGGRIIIMPGSGVRADNIAALMATTHATEFHSSGLKGNDKFIADEAELKNIMLQLRS
jgi:copper homeostasis protein